MLKLVQPVPLSELPQSEKKKIIAQHMREQRERALQDSLDTQKLYSELFPGSRIGPMATDAELEEALRTGIEECYKGFLPSMQGIFTEIGGRTDRAPKWAKVNAGAHIPHRLKGMLPKLVNTALCQELDAGGMMTHLDQAEMCSHSPATFTKVAARHLGIVRQQRMMAQELKRVAKDLHETQLQVLELRAKGSPTEEWVASAVELRKQLKSWDDIATAVHKRRKTVIDAVTAALELEKNNRV